ncbi:MAG: hypothetical protein A2233_00765 [Candidatus Kerfeldbacteria bacterium RIFOXYA2_FULL_38_24]|uniref:Helicase ATP-binding domain-containing protein n=1 Tax=Candidatus Kerfeldbacteria bacterium RIFOXYB2_FULL_38_14 TaxID=1798547 RepID=A0A1G2BHD5_9BACT|nr:MAG: hypothetical protein A2233_00765 [Candidatus Kerfeldbacteria bacterium RIFOXYA2_FULL_38_24]OGY88086.1 MAG: hypothetical protein A2319_01495 [Candidatus Kerfeldbacteria bacterium RIFOXYB2_FULL_38_14]OGY88444.1 MAG: hypothetical protein A2458_02370 [Candidatus Kerfeldbacteria bacterium RIFOXYC2_FULL_38_9]
MRKWLKALNSLDQYISNHHKGNEKRTLREKQLTVFEDLRNYLEAGGSEGYVKLPTGFGKTVLFTEFLEALNLSTVIVVPTQILVEQTEEKVSQFAPASEVGKIYARAKEFGRQVTIITYDSFIDGVENETIKPKDVDLLILDEVHQALSPRRSQTIQQFSRSIKLGFTATPEYSEEKKVQNILPHEIHRMDIREAVEDGLLSPFSAIIAHTDVDLSKVKIISSGEYDERDLAKAVNIERRNQSAVQLYQQAFQNESTVAFCVGVNHAAEMARLFNEANISAVAISGQTPSNEQKRILGEYAKGNIKVLCNADLLITGFDQPKASACFNLRPTRSRVIAEQRAGRVLRLDDNNPDKFAYIVDFLDVKYNKKKPPVLFADIAGAATIVHKKKAAKTGVQLERRGWEYKDLAQLHIQGLQITVNTEEVLRIVAQLQQEMEEEQRFLPFNELQEQVRAAGIQGKDEYIEVYKQHFGWPSNPNTTYKENWKDWHEFLGKEKIFLLPFAELQEQVRAAGIQSERQYREVYKQHFGWPSSPDSFDRDNWKSWYEFLGKEDKFLSFTELQEQVRAAGIQGKGEYIKVYKQHFGWPSSPTYFYKENWPGWDEFLGKNK